MAAVITIPAISYSSLRTVPHRWLRPGNMMPREKEKKKTKEQNHWSKVLVQRRLGTMACLRKQLVVVSN